MANENVILTLRKIFPDITFNIRTVINEDIKFIFDESTENHAFMEPAEHLYFILKTLEHDLRKAKKKLAKVLKFFKIGEATIEEVQDCEFYVYDIELEIQDISARLNSH